MKNVSERGHVMEILRLQDTREAAQLMALVGPLLTKQATPSLKPSWKTDISPSARFAQ